MQGNATNATDIKDRIRSYVSQNFLSATELDAVRDDDDLLMLFDSLQLLRMLLELEAQYQFKAANSELTPENLGSIDKLAMFIARKLA